MPEFATACDAALTRFSQRCQTLGATLWRYDRSSAKLTPLSTSSAGQDWLCSEAMGQRLSQCLESVSDEQETICEIDPGIFAVMLGDDHSHKVVAVLLGNDAGRGAGFAEDCEAASLQPDEVLDQISGIRRYDRSELSTLQTTLNWSLNDLRSLDEQTLAIDDLTENLSHSYENITLLYRLGRSMSSLQAPALITQSICAQLQLTQSFGWVAAQFAENEESVPDLTGSRFIAGELPCDHQAFHAAVERLLVEMNADSWSKLLQVGSHEIADLAGSEIIADPINHDGQVVGVVLGGGRTGPDCEAKSNDIQLVDAIASFLGTFHENAARFHEQRKMFIGTLEAVSNALDAKDRYTCGHSERVAHLATRLAEAMGLDEEEVERLRIAGLVHDVGKIGVPEAVLCKAGRLTDDEFEKIKKHPRIGYNILKGIPKMEDVLDGVLYHHERWDGRGYPDRLGGESIPLYGRILAVCDTFDAMSSTRSYRRAMPREEVLAEIMRCSGTQFDPQLTGAFVGLSFNEFDQMVARHQEQAELEAADKQVAA